MKSKFSIQLLTLFIILGASCHLSAQENVIHTKWKPLYDSLVKYSQIRDTSKVRIYAEELFTSEAFGIHDSLKVKIGAITASLEIEETKALKFLNLIETNLLKSEENRNLLGWNYFFKGNWYYNNFYDKKSLIFYNKADSLFTAINRKSFYSAMTKVSICDVLMKSGLNENSLIIDQVLPYIEEGLYVSDSLGLKVPLAILLYKKGDLYFAKGELDHSELFYRKSLAVSEKIKNDVRQALIFDRLAKISLERNLLDSAVIYQEKAVLKAKNIDNLSVISEVNLDIGIVYNKIEKYDAAIKHLIYAKEVLQNSRFNRREPYHDIEYNLAEAYYGKNEYETAYGYLKSAKLNIQEAQKIKNEERVEEIEAKYQTEKKEQEIILLKSKNQLVEQQKTNQRNILIGGILATSLAGLFFFYLYRTRQRITDKLKELDHAKSTFFANISHEFRTPLTMISGPLQSQLQKKDLKEEDKSTFNMMYRNSTRLLALVDQLLDISKIEAGRLRLKVTKNDILPFIGMLADGFAFKAQEKEIEYTVSNSFSEVDSYFDSDVLEKIVVNLISNAIKYTPEKGSVVCEADVQKDSLRFAIKNTGKTLSKKEITNIFDRFYQIDESTQGAGIGLALVKELVLLHKGSIKVESMPNGWTSFKVIIPINRSRFSESEIVSVKQTIELRQKADTNHSSIETAAMYQFDKEEDDLILLVVDDNADVRTYVTSLFRNAYKVLQATNGQEGIDIAVMQIPDIIISDVMMPIITGIQLCNRLKTDERTSHVPIILLTAKAGEENEIEGINTGADDYITKPFNEKLLKLRVENLVENRRKLQLRYSQEVVLKPKNIAITSVDEQFIERLQKVLDHKLTEPSFNVEEFSKTVGMSRMQLHRKLKALTGVSSSEFIRSERLKLAAQLLKKSKINVSEAGYSVGFSDHAYFSKCFKKRYQCTPTEYAQNSEP